MGLPKSSESVEFSAVVEEGTPVRKALKLSARNLNFEKAITLATDMRVTSSAMAKKKAREALVKILTTPITVEELGTSRFVVSIQSPYLSCARDLGLASDYGSNLSAGESVDIISCLVGVCCISVYCIRLYRIVCCCVSVCRIVLCITLVL